ncbi:MAG: TolC family protein [Pseudomonadota bacterium]
MAAPFVLVVGCASVPPAPERPKTLQVASVVEIVETDSVSIEPVVAAWWGGFRDETLSALIETALLQNRDLAVAEANVQTARAVLARQALQNSKTTLSTGDVSVGRPTRQDADVDITGSGQIGASWEYDAFGRIAAEIASAEFDVIALQERRRDVAVIIAAETALAYSDMTGNQVRLSVARANAELQRESLNLLETLFENGRATQLDLERARSQFRTTLALIPQLQANVQTAAVRLSTLTGEPGTAAAILQQMTSLDAAQIPSPPDVLSIGTPEALIRRRPDIRAAEADISSLLALGEAERARLFPTLTFNANVLSLLSEDNDLDDSFGFSVGPAIRWDGPDLRRVRANIDITDAQTRAAFAAYELAVVNALGEVEAALIAYTNERARQADLEVAATSAERAVELARLRFEEGLDDFLDLIDAQRTLLDTQDRLEISRLTATRQAIAAYRALGGVRLPEPDALADESET